MNQQEDKKTEERRGPQFSVTEADQDHEFSKEKMKAVGFDIYAFFRNLVFAVFLESSTARWA